jgi:catechol-2,3-dioxygenase
MPSTQPSKPSAGARISHLVLTVRDIDASERFYTEVLGFERCGLLEGPLAVSEMRFFRAGESHHDLALVQVGKPDEVPAPPEEWEGFFPDHSVGINHFAVAYPDREAWLAQLAHLQARGVQFDLRGNHGMTHSVYVRDPDGHSVEVLYDLPAEVWEGDVNAALNHFEMLPSEGPESLVDDTDYQRFEPARG